MVLKLDFSNVGGPTEKMKALMYDMCEYVPMEDRENYSEKIWDDFKLAGKFISDNMEVFRKYKTREWEISIQRICSTPYYTGYHPCDAQYEGYSGCEGMFF